MPSFSDLASPGATREVLERFGLSPKKSFGQNFLINDGIIGKILELADVAPDDCVLEVGPGIGTLTNALLKRAARVVAVERDPSLPEVLSHTLAEWRHKFTLVHKDALDLKCSDIGEPLPNTMAANLPYAVAATIILDYFQRFPFLDSMTVMVQKEVAERICAKPATKEYGAYTVKLSMFASPVGGFAVGPSNFMPAPHVDSAVIRLDRKEAATAEQERELIQAACIMADAAFASRRKTIANSCKAYFSGRGSEGKRTAEVLPEIFEGAGIDPKLRGEVLDPDAFRRLGCAFLKAQYQS